MKDEQQQTALIFHFFFYIHLVHSQFKLLKIQILKNTDFINNWVTTRTLIGQKLMV